MSIIILRTKDGQKTYFSSSGEPPSMKEIELARKYDEELQKKIKEIKNSLRKKGFLDKKNKMRKWYALGKELHFLDKMSLRIECDPNLKNTFRILYDLALDLAPTKNLPTDKERLRGNRNHFYVCYQLAKFSWELVKNIPWGNWTDIHAALDAIGWKDKERLLLWILKNSKENDKINRKKLRKALMVLRSIVGKTAEVEKDTTVLSEKELYNLLDKKLTK